MKTLNKKFLTFGIIGTIASFLIIIADISGGIGEFTGNFWEQYADFNSLRLFLSSHMTIYIFPFFTLGIIALYKVLEPASKITSAIFCFCLWLLTYVMTAVHAGYPYLAHLSYYNQQVDNPQIVNILKLYTENIGTHLIILYSLALVASLGIFILIISGKTMMKKWTALCNPIFAILLSIIIGMISPTLGKYYGTFCPMFGLFSLFLCATITIYKKIR